ncbi:unnamed protein product [Caenorhabditis sp. 36 PRJEB53466]|nr:unnamed protein product [Caenorhabditis sp. 36 PRJEB53466]
MEVIDVAMNTLREQSKPLKKSLNSTLFSTDTQLLELVAVSTRDALMEIGGSAVIDPLEAGQKVGAALQRASQAMKHYQSDKHTEKDFFGPVEREKCDGMYNDIYFDSEMLEDHRFASRAGFFHRHFNDLLLFTNEESSFNDYPDSIATSLEPVVYPFNVECDFVLQMIDVEQVEKQKKKREKVEKEKTKPAELVKVNDKASTVQKEEVSITNELDHVLKTLKKELKARKVDSIGYYEFVTNPTSFPHTIENMFYISYLMRDRQVFLVEIDGVPTLKRPSQNHEAEKKELVEQGSCHGVTSLSYDQWKRLAAVISKPIIDPLDS